MLYHLALYLLPYATALNVLTYHTVRAGAAALTAFVFCLLVGPGLIRHLQALKIGQVIKKDHVADLHALHKSKQGTPTMGGTMMLIATLLSLLLWSTLTNRLLWLGLSVLLILGVVGFLDDYIKLKRKHNHGLSARAKFVGQILAGLLLGAYLVFNPITVSAGQIQDRDVLDWMGFMETLSEGDGAAAYVWGRMDTETRDSVAEAAREGQASPLERLALLAGLSDVLKRRNFYNPELWPADKLNAEAQGLLQDGVEALNQLELVRLNRLLMEDAFPQYVAQSHPNQHTKVGIPGLKDVYIPMGIFYIVFVILIIVATSNAVNLTDGLDGLATGASVISILAYTGIAYVVSRADWSEYLYVTYVPEASELFVFGGALLGAGLGFLWFNGHPAEVLMGDTGSLALGGAIASMAVLTKHELLLPLVAGLFVLEAGSVVVQVASFKLTGKRIFRMAPLHHHFELLGWSETKVTMRFWIIALLFALMSLGTLKLR